jgi:ABC-2 type transport system permease protein
VSAETAPTVDREPRHAGTTLDVVRYEAERRVRVSAVVAVALSLFAAMFVWIGPSVTASGEIDQLTEALPPLFRSLLGFETMGSLAGLLAGEFYTFAWLVGLGGYLAYSAAGSVAGDLRSDRMDTVLAAPVSRTSVLLGKYLALLVPIAVANVAVPVVLYAGSRLVDAPLPAADLLAVHALSVPYLLCWGAVGLLAGVVVRRGRTASRAALGVVVAAWLGESLVVGSDIAWLGAVAPMRHYDPPAVLVDGSYDLAGAAVLSVAAVVLVALASAAFARADL